MKVFLISPVRKVTKSERIKIEKYVVGLEGLGHTVHWPERDTNQNDKIGMRICLDNLRAIKEADEAHIWWKWTKRNKSIGSLFDFGMAFAIGKKIILANPEKVPSTEVKSFNNVLLALHEKNWPKREMVKSKSVKASTISDQVYAIFPNDLNPLGTLFGGRATDLIDMIGAIAAGRHSEKVCVTASIDNIEFVHPARAGDILILKASVNNAWNTSCEVGVKVFVENHQTKEIHHLTSAYLTFVALNESGNPSPMPKIIPETRQEKRRFKEAEIRRKIRLEKRAARKHLPTN